MEKSTVKTIMKLIVATVFLCFALANLSAILGILRNLAGLLSPFLIGGCIAFILNVLLKVWEEKVFRKAKISQKLKRMISILLTLISVLFVLFIVIWLVVPQLISAGESIAVQIPAAWERAEAFINDNIEADTQIGLVMTQIGENGEKMIAELAGYLKNSSGHILSATVDVVSGTLGALINLFMSLIFAIYILTQKEKLLGQAKQVMQAFLPEKAAGKIAKVCRLTEETFRKFITGQCLEAVILGSIFFVAISLFRMPYALPISVLISLLSLIPIFGTLIGCVVGTVLILVVNPMQAIGFVALFLIIQQVEGNLIYPHVVGNSVGLPSIWVFTAVLIGGKLFGIAGMLMFIPLCSVAYVLFRDEVKRRIRIKVGKSS